MEDALKRLVNSLLFKYVALREVLELLLAFIGRIYYGTIDLFSYFTLISTSY